MKNKKYWLIASVVWLVLSLIIANKKARILFPGHQPVSRCYTVGYPKTFGHTCPNDTTIGKPNFTNVESWTALTYDISIIFLVLAIPIFGIGFIIYRRTTK